MDTKSARYLMQHPRQSVETWFHQSPERRHWVAALRIRSPGGPPEGDVATVAFGSTVARAISNVIGEGWPDADDRPRRRR